MSKPILKTVSQEPEFETFQLNRLGRKWGRYNFLREMPLGAHCHFTDKLHRNDITEFNQRLYTEGSTLHFSVHKVGDDDPKGPGFRVLRDDKPIRHRSKKREAAQ